MINTLVAEFTDKLTKEVEESVRTRILAALGEPTAAPKRRGRPPKVVAVQGEPTAAPKRRGRPPKAVQGEPVAMKPKRKMTPELARARALQGKYLGTLRSLTGAARKQVKAAAKAEGVAAALKLAKTLVKT